MVELTLPRNSKIKPGKTWPKPEGATRLREYRIYRWSPDDEENPRLDTYYVDLDDCGPMVLDGLLWIKNKVDPTLTLRYRPVHTETMLPYSDGGIDPAKIAPKARVY